MQGKGANDSQRFDALVGDMRQQLVNIMFVDELVGVTSCTELLWKIASDGMILHMSDSQHTQPTTTLC